MSEQTAEALEQALAAHIADENDGALVVAYLITTAAVLTDDDSVNRMSSIVPPTQPLYVSMGLSAYTQRAIEKSVGP